jgi:hypothetical protein
VLDGGPVDIVGVYDLKGVPEPVELYAFVRVS